MRLRPNRRDRKLFRTTRVSRPPGSQTNGDSLTAAISTNGRFVVFVSEATNLVSGDTNGKRDIFLFNGTTGGNKRVSVGPGGKESNGSSAPPAIDGIGDFVVFESTATNLVPSDANGKRDIFVFTR